MTRRPWILDFCFSNPFKNNNDESVSKLSANDHPIKSSDSKQKIGNPMKQVLCEAATQKGKCIRPEFAHILRTCHDMRHFVRLYIDG